MALSEHNKIFVGGITQETCDETMAEHFEKYGRVIKAEVIKHKITGCCRGFGFVTFEDSSSLHRALQDQHVIAGRKVELRVAIPKRDGVGQLDCQECLELQQRQHNNRYNEFVVKKIFVGGLPSGITNEELRSYFESFGAITDVEIYYDQENRPRGFGFITFDSDTVVNTILSQRFHKVKDKQVEVKRAEPRERNKLRLGRTGFEPTAQFCSNNYYGGGGMLGYYYDAVPAASYGGATFPYMGYYYQYWNGMYVNNVLGSPSFNGAPENRRR